MQGWAPLVMGLVMALSGMAHAQVPDYIIELNNAPLKPVVPQQAKMAKKAVASAQVATTAAAPAVAPVVPVPVGSKPRQKVHIALVLPTESPLFGDAARVVRQGFDAAAATDDDATVDYVDEQENNVVARYRAAINNGAQVIVGPLTRSGIAAITPYAKVPTLVLNTFDKPVGNLRLLSLSLAVEGEARQIAALMNDDGRSAPLVIAGADPLSRRLADAFVKEWQARTGRIALQLEAGGDGKVSADSLAQADSVLLALDAKPAAPVRKALPDTLPVYASSMINSREPDPALAGIRFVDMPWFLMPEQAEVKRYPRPDTLLTLQTERLYALGVDAYRLAVTLAGSAYNPRSGYAGLSINGVTGNLRLGRNHQFERIQPVSIIGVDKLK